MIIYHIARKTSVQDLSDGEEYTGDTLKTEGFIHCSTAAQVMVVANQRFKGQSGLVLLCIEMDLVNPEIRFENLEGGNNLFPHIYGPLNREAIRKIVELTPGKDGDFTFPGDAY